MKLQLRKTPYREEFLNRLEPSLTKEKRLILGAMGICGESGEVSEHIKKFVFYDKQIPSEKIIEELGDIRWYFELLLDTFNLTMEEVEQQNIEKLKKRYPNGFNKEDAISQKDKK